MNYEIIVFILIIVLYYIEFRFFFYIFRTRYFEKSTRKIFYLRNFVTRRV